MFALHFMMLLSAFREHPIPPSTQIGGFVQVNEILCETARYAMDFAAALSKGDASELAKDSIGKQAHRQVCGRFIGLATPAKAVVATSGGVVYQLTAFRFKEDNRVGWLAESSFAPKPNNSEIPL